MTTAKKPDWISTPNEHRKRRMMMVTLGAETIELLEQLAATLAIPKSRVVDRAIVALASALKKSKTPRSISS